MSRSTLLFAIAFSLCVGFFGCSKGGGGGGGGGCGGGGIDAALVGVYFGDVYDRFYDDGTYESEDDWYSYAQEIILSSDGTWILTYFLDGYLEQYFGTWSAEGGNTLNLFASGVPGCACVAITYTLVGLDLTLFWDHPCGDDYYETEYYTYVGAPVTLPADDRLSRSTTIGD